MTNEVEETHHLSEYFIRRPAGLTRYTEMFLGLLSNPIGDTYLPNTKSGPYKKKMRFWKKNICKCATQGNYMNF